MDEIEKLKEELQQTRLAYQMALKINQFKTGFLGRTAHEIRSPLSSLISLHQLILGDLCESPEEERDFLNQANEAAKKLVKIIDDIILVSRLEYGRIPLAKEAVDLGELLDQIYAFVYLPAANKNLKLNVIELNEPLLILADRKRLLSSLISLIDTAIEWMPQGEITLQATSENQLGIIQLIIDSPVSIWQESQDLLQQTPPTSKTDLQKFAQQLEMSAGEKFLLALNVIEAMGGNLSLIENPQNSNFSQLQIIFPLILS